MKRFFSVTAVSMAIIAMAVTALAASGALRAKTSTFNPGGATVTIVSAWKPHTGLPDAGKSDHGLTLSITSLVPFPPGASADATIEPVQGVTLSALGLDHKMGTYCTNGSPRYDVETTNGGVYGFGCAAGIHIPNFPATGWERIIFTDADVQNLSGPVWPGFGNATLSFLQLLQDEAGTTVVDNLFVNGITIGKPGNAFLP